MYKHILKKVSIIVVTLISFSSSASLITANGSAAGALDLNGISASFKDFYNLTSSSPNTGFEVANEVVMFVAELNNEYALFATISGGLAATRGRLKAEFTFGNGSFLLFDDPHEILGTTATWKTGIGKGDGFIFGEQAGLLDLTIDLSYLLDISTYKFLTFDSAGVSSVLLSGAIPSGELIVSANRVNSAIISEPTILAIFGLGFIGLVLRRKY